MILAPILLLFSAGTIDSWRLASTSTIEVDEVTCTLVKAIENANDNVTGQPYPECAPGDPIGPDTIRLMADVVLTEPFGPFLSGLPQIYSQITIEGEGHSIARGKTTDNFRLFENTGDGDLTIKNAILTGGSLSYLRAGGAVANAGKLTLINSTIKGNEAGGGGAIFSQGELIIINSTISGNVAKQNGGGLSLIDWGEVSIINSTITNNEVEGGVGGGIALPTSGVEVRIANSIVSGNSAYSASVNPIINSAEIYLDDNSAVTVDQYNIFSHTGLTEAQAFTGFTPGLSDIDASSDSLTPYQLASILDSVIGLNGGATLTHALVPGSPAIDLVPSIECENSTDQRGYERNKDGDGNPSLNECDAGAFEYGHLIPTATPTKSLDPTETSTISPTVSPTLTITPTATETSTISPTVSPTLTITPTATETSTISPTVSPTLTVTPTATVPATLTPQPPPRWRIAIPLVVR